MSAGSKAFFDTNILLYMHGGEDAGKRARAIELFEEYAGSGRMVLSTQVVEEFYVVGRRKVNMSKPELRAATLALLDYPLVAIEAPQIRAALVIEERYRISFWDALILSAAEAGGAAVVYTEDLNHAQKYGKVTVANPFR